MLIREDTLKKAGSYQTLKIKEESANKREWRMGRHTRCRERQEQRFRPGETASGVEKINPLWTRKLRHFNGEKEKCFQQMVLGQLDILVKESKV